jgi:asparagine synthetase A
MSYISSADITDSSARKFVDANDTRVAQWMACVDSEIKSIAISYGVDSDDIETTPLHPKIKEYAVAYFCQSVFIDCIGATLSNPTQDEVYRVKYDIYSDRVSKLRSQLTYEMFTGNALTQESQVGSGVIWRG